MSSQGRRIIITPTQHSSLSTCNPNLMPFHIGYTGPAAVSMYLRVEKMKAEEEMKEQNEKFNKGAVVVDEESKVTEATVNEGEHVKEVEVKVAAANDSTTKDENNDSNTNTNVEDEDVKMKSDLLSPADPVQDQDSQLTDVEMSNALPTLPSSSSSLSTIPSSSFSNTLSGSIQSLASESTSTLVSSESLNSSILATPSSASSSSNLLPQISSSVLKDLDKRSISSFRGHTIHGLTVDVPTGYTGLLLQGDPEPTADHVTRVEAESAFEGEDEVDSGSRKTRSKGKGVNGKAKGKAKEKEKEHTKKALPKGRLARTAAPRLVVKPEVITIVDNEDQEMTGPAPSNTTEPAAEVTNGDLELTNDDTNAPDDDLEVAKEIPLRKLIPQSTFSSITLWHADRAVDETRDEYYRTLTEWMAVSHEIHRTDL